MLRFTLMLIAGLLVAGCQSSGPKTVAAPRFLPVKSQLFQAACYNPAIQELALVTIDGVCITYEGVPEKVYQRFMITPGKSGYWKANIYRMYPKRVQKPEAEEPEQVVGVKIGLHTPAQTLDGTLLP